MSIVTFLVLAALILSGYSLVDSRGRGILNWAVFCLALAVAWPLVRGL